jgi:hypothetical protein
MIELHFHTRTCVTALAAALLFTLFSHRLTAQSNINTQAFFSLVEETVTPATISTSKVKMPWFESYELRTETRDFDLDQQEYTFRLSPSTRKKVRAQESLYRHLEAAPDFEVEDDRCEALAGRYTDWIELYFLSREGFLLQQLERVRADQSTVLNRLAGALDFDWSELIKTREEQTDLMVDYLGVQDRSEYFSESYGLQNAALDFTDLLPLNEVRERIRKATLIPTDPELAYELEMINRELELEHAERKQYLDFAQIKYRGPHDNPARERLSVGVGLQLPNSGNQKVKVRELELKAKSLRSDQAREAAGDITDFEERRQLLLERFGRYDTFSELYLREAQEFEGLSRKLTGQEGVNPLPLLKIKARALRNELKLLEQEAELYDGYLDLMERNDEVCGASKGELLR